MSQEAMAFLEDIFCIAKIRETARELEQEVRFIRDVTGLARRLSGPAPFVALVDLTADSLEPLDIIRDIKANPEWRNVRVVAYASLSRAELMEQASQQGADVVLSKPDFVKQLPELLQGAMA